MKKKKSADWINALVVEMRVKRMEERIPLREVGPLLNAQYATVWRWEKGISVPNQFHVHQLKKWLGYL